MAGNENYQSIILLTEEKVNNLIYLYNDLKKRMENLEKENANLKHTIDAIMNRKKETKIEKLVLDIKSNKLEITNDQITPTRITMPNII